MNDLKAIFSKINKGLINNVYFLKGNDQFLQNFFIEKLYKNLFLEPLGHKEFLTPTEFSGKEIIDRILSNDIFATKKLFIIKDPQQIKGKALNELLIYFQNPVKNHYLVLINDNFLDNSSFTKKIHKNVPSINVSKPSSNEMEKWARFFIKENQKTISNELLKELVDSFGDNLYNLKNEIDKICLLTNSDHITKKQANTNTPFSIQRNRSDLIKAIGNRNVNEAIVFAKSIINNSETMISMIIPLLAFFQEILFIKMNNGTFLKQDSYIPLSASIKNSLTTFAKNFSENEIIFSIRKLKEIEIKQKISTIDDESEIISFIYNAIGKFKK